ncbi:MAG: glucokinase [Gemmobacter sp.]|uniref:glucokinase n=1 Tax=Gemmobacter sp. TaxID=1898957 RepID=UPI003918B731
MTILVADVGGTNCRFALGERGRGLRALARLANDAHADFAAALGSYLAAQGHPALSAACFAVAGPVTQGKAALTNRGWHFDTATLSAQLGAPVRLINDLAALGHALPQLGPSASLAVWTPPAAIANPNGQRLVLGLGTGVNASLVATTGSTPVVLEAEAGHQSLPLSVARLLAPHVPDPGAPFPSTEELFAGRGLARLHGLLHGTPQDGATIIAAHAAGNPQATATLDLFARLMGAWVKDVALQYLPRDGLFLAGSVARGVIEAGFAPAFLGTFTSPHRFPDLVQSVPVRLLTDDMAALSGCLAAA